MKNINPVSDYAKMADEKLVALIREGADNAFNELAERFTKTVIVRSSKYNSVSLTREDWVQEGMIGLLMAVRSFNANRGVSFATYANVCIENRLRSVCKKASGNSNAPLNESLTLDDAVVPPDVSTEESYIRHEDSRFLTEKFFSILSVREKKVIDYYIAGFSYQEIALKLNMSEKSVDNALCRAKSKLKKAL